MTIDEKINYLKRFIDGEEGRNIKNGGNTLIFANSIEECKECEKLIHEISYYFTGIYGQGLRKYTRFFTSPTITQFEICPELIEFIKNYK